MTFATTTTAMQTPRSVNVTVKLDASDRDRLRSLAAAKKRTSHYIMKEAIQRYIREEEIEERFISAAEAAWEDFEKTGLHITLDEAKNWAKALKSNSDAALPSCHK